MAKKNLYAVLDTATGIYDGPMPAHTDEQVKRQFVQLATNAENPIGQNPKDFAIIRTGIWNDGTGELTDTQNITLMTGLEAVAFSRKETVVQENMEKISAGGTA